MSRHQRLDDRFSPGNQGNRINTSLLGTVENKFILKINTSASLVSAIILIRLKNPDILNYIYYQMCIPKYNRR